MKLKFHSRLCAAPFFLRKTPYVWIRRKNALASKHFRLYYSTVKMTIPVNIKKFFNFFSMDWNLRDNSALLIWKATYYLYPSGAKLFSRNYILTEISRKNLRYLYRGQILARRHWPSFFMPEHNKFKEEKRREHIVKTETKDDRRGSIDGKQTGSKTSPPTERLYHRYSTLYLLRSAP